MTVTPLLAKPVIKNKFWIVEDQGTQVGTIQAIENGGFVFADADSRQRYPSIKVLSKEHNVVFDKQTINKQKKTDHTAYGFPVSQKAWNVLWDLRHQLAVFTKDPNSKSYYCAGHYLVKINGEWAESFCPKLITLNRYEFRGPFKTQEEMRARKDG